MWQYNDYAELYHYGVKGMKWGKHSRRRINSGPGLSISTGKRVDGGPTNARKKQGKKATYIISPSDYSLDDTIKGIQEVQKELLSRGRVYAYRKGDADGWLNYTISSPFANNQSVQENKLDDDFIDYVTGLTGNFVHVHVPQDARVWGREKVHQRLQKESEKKKESKAFKLKLKRAVTKKRIENALKKKISDVNIVRGKQRFTNIVDPTSMKKRTPPRKKTRLSVMGAKNQFK